MIEEFKPIADFNEQAIDFDTLPDFVRPLLSDEECNNKLLMLILTIKEQGAILEPFDKYRYVNVAFRDLAYFDRLKTMDFDFKYEIILTGDLSLGIFRIYL